ncbi:hypothetical protein FOBRF1_000043 [Fusarium oxysporum]
MIWRCPKCCTKPRTFTKNFDLHRHYAQRHFGYDGACAACNAKIKGGRVFWDHKCDRELDADGQEKYIEQRKSFREDVAKAIIVESEEPKHMTLDQMDEILGLMEVTEDVQIPPNSEGDFELTGPSNRGTEHPEPEENGSVHTIQYPSDISSIQSSQSVHEAPNLARAYATPQALFNQATSQNREIDSRYGTRNIDLIPRQSLYDRHVHSQSTIQLEQHESTYPHNNSHCLEDHCSEGTGNMQDLQSINPILLQSLYDQHTKYPLNTQAHQSKGLYDRRVPELERANIAPSTNFQWSGASLPRSGPEPPSV